MSLQEEILAVVKDTSISFDEKRKRLLKNDGHVECREYSDYYKDRCTYVENGVRYLVPYDAITFYVGHGDRAKKATVLLKDITCDGEVILFYLGDVISQNNE